MEEILETDDKQHDRIGRSLDVLGAADWFNAETDSTVFEEHAALLQRPGEAWFWSLTLPRPEPRGCLEWQGTRNEDGYGWFRRVGPKKFSAHRTAAEMVHGPRPAGSPVTRHLCDNPACVRPAHLTYGTQAENLVDAQRRRAVVREDRLAERVIAPVGADTWKAIVALAKRGKVSVKDLATLFGVQAAAIRGDMKGGVRGPMGRPKRTV
jgi:hypothetical protein